MYSRHFIKVAPIDHKSHPDQTAARHAMPFFPYLIAFAQKPSADEGPEKDSPRGFWRYKDTIFPVLYQLIRTGTIRKTDTWNTPLPRLQAIQVGQPSLKEARTDMNMRLHNSAKISSVGPQICTLFQAYYGSSLDFIVMTDFLYRSKDLYHPFRK
ncbi:MAG: hypothetical protein R2875_17525 [Desulfobacterales bacterium]